VNNRFQSLVSGAVLAVAIGWVLHVGKDVFVPIIFGALVVYVIAGLTRLLGRIPVIGRILPPRMRSALSVVVIAWGLVAIANLILANKDSVLALAPQYQESLLAVIQRGAVLLHIETEPTWTTLRRDLFGQISLQPLIGSMVASVSAIAVTVIVVLLYASFLLIEQRSFDAKIAAISSDPRIVARVRQVTSDINSRIGAYLALKTFLSILLGLTSWIVMAFMGLEFAAFWAVVIALLNYVPYIGSFLGVLFPVTMAIVQFANPNDVLAVFLPLTALQFLIGNFLDPYVMGNSLNLSPFAILVSLAAWSALWGIPGAFLAVPITAIMAIVFSGFAGTRPLAVLLSRDGRL
jgi:predicted PurR-regulated permease PerM